MNIESLFPQWLRGEGLTCRYSMETLTWSWRGSICTGMTCGKSLHETQTAKTYACITKHRISCRFHRLSLFWALGRSAVWEPELNINEHCRFHFILVNLWNISPLFFSPTNQTAYQSYPFWVTQCFSDSCASVFWLLLQSKAQHDSDPHGQRLKRFDLLQWTEIRRQRRLHLSVAKWPHPGVSLRPWKGTSYHQVKIVRINNTQKLPAYKERRGMFPVSPNNDHRVHK